MERTVCIFKPDLAANRQAAGEALAKLLLFGLMPVNLFRHRLARATVDRLYAEHTDKLFYGEHASFMTSGPSTVMVLERAEEAVGVLRTIVGATDPKKAEPWTLRALFGTNLPKNAVHASDSIEAAKREMEILGLL